MLNAIINAITNAITSVVANMITNNYNVFIVICMFIFYYTISLFRNKEDKIDNRIYYTMLVPIFMYIYKYMTSNNVEPDTISYRPTETYISSNESLMSEPYPVSSSI
jgi:hypothetical protein